MVHRPATTATHSVTVHERLSPAIGDDQAHRGGNKSAFMGPRDLSSFAMEDLSVQPIMSKCAANGRSPSTNKKSLFHLIRYGSVTMAESSKRMPEASPPEFYGGRVLLPSHNRPRRIPPPGRQRAKKAVSPRTTFLSLVDVAEADELLSVYELPCTK